MSSSEHPESGQVRGTHVSVEGLVGQPLRILIVDDHVDAADSARRLLEMRGGSVAVAHSGEQALTRFRERTPDLVLMDLLLGDMDGFAVVRRMLEGRPEPRPYFVAVSGLSEPEDRERSRSAGFDLHLVKPVEPARLFALLDQTLRRRT